jgi:hypothetical protein
MNSEPTKILSRLPLHCKFTRAGVGYSFFLFDQLVATATAIRLMDASPRAGGELRPKKASRTQAVARVRVAGSFGSATRAPFCGMYSVILSCLPAWWGS